MPASHAMTSAGPSTSGVTPLRSKDPSTRETPKFHTQSIAEEQDEIFILKVSLVAESQVLAGYSVELRYVVLVDIRDAAAGYRDVTGVLHVHVDDGI